MEDPHKDPDEFIEYLIGNLKGLIEENGDPTNELLDRIITEFIKSMMWEKDSLDAIVTVWGKFPPPDVKGIIGTFQSIFKSISRGRMELHLHPRYVEVFRDAPTLRIPRSVLSKRTLRMLVLIEDEELWTYFFTIKKDEGFNDGDCAEYRGFRFNKVLEENVDRISLIRIIVFKTVFLFMTIDDGKYLIDCIHCLMAAIQNCLNVVPVIRDGRIEKKRKWDAEDDGLSAILTILGKSSFYNTMLKVWSHKRSR